MDGLTPFTGPHAHLIPHGGQNRTGVHTTNDGKRACKQGRKHGQIWVAADEVQQLPAECEANKASADTDKSVFPIFIVCGAEQSHPCCGWRSNRIAPNTAQIKPCCCVGRGGVWWRYELGQGEGVCEPKRPHPPHQAASGKLLCLILAAFDVPVVEHHLNWR
jgi:hypothetical protein